MPSEYEVTSIEQSHVRLDSRAFIIIHATG